MGGSCWKLGLPGCAGLKAGLSLEGQKDAGLLVHEGGRRRIRVFPGQGGSYSLPPPAGQMEGGILLSYFLTGPGWGRGGWLRGLNELLQLFVP